MKRLWPKSLAGQLVLLLVLTLLVAQIFVLVLSASDRLRLIAGVQASQTLAPTSALVRLLADTPREEWPRLTSAFVDFRQQISIDELAAVSDEKHHRRHPLAKGIDKRLPPGFGPTLVDIEKASFFDREHWRRDEDDDEEDEYRSRRDHRKHGAERVRMTIAIGLPDGSWLNFKHHLRPPPIWAGITWGYFFLSALLISLVAYFAVRRITRPLRALAGAAERFGRGDAVEHLPEDGAIELRKAAGAFNRMADRIGRFVRDRTAMIAAMSHDLRTPITSLRLRAEFVEDEENREKMLDTLDEMATMTEATLDFARQDAKAETSQALDLAATLESLVEDLRDQGLAVEMGDLEREVIQARPTALKRALRNLLENAVRYGESANLSLERADGQIRIHIDDQGPGIPDDDLERVFEPFTRLESSRNRSTGGTGLGLAIARTIIHGHGGEIDLVNQPNGLRATVTLPV